MVKRLTIEETRELIVKALVANKTSQDNANSVASALIGAQMSGQGGHGLRRLVAYSAQARCGKVDGFAKPKASLPRPAIVHIDGGNGFAFPALDLAIEELARITPIQGIAMAGIYRSHHAGVTGLVVERLARLGLISLLFSTAPASMAPWGAKKPIFGTNPIAFGAPVLNDDPIIVDLSLSRVARGHVMAAVQKGEPIPDNWAFDAEGNPTTDANDAIKGTMAPMGDAKGTALALMVEILAAGLIGANFSTQQSSFFDDQGGPTGTGQMVVAIDPQAFGSSNAFERITQLAHELENTKGARLPGRKRHETRRDVHENGIQLEMELFQQLEKLC